ncbi:MAG: protein kinase domain-containing protein, partial [Anaeromyxobacteraceae bacterium]
MSATASPPDLPHHELLRPLGGASFLLRHALTGALQVARAVAAPVPAAARRRAERLAAVRHPGLGPPALVVEGRGAVWAVRAFVEGEALRDVLARGEGVPAPLEAAGAICSAVAALHAAGLAHGRLHSGNVVRGAAGWVVVDALEPFRPPGAEECGALAYAAPEVLRGRGGGPRADVFSLGLLLHALLAGREPVAEREPLEVVRAILYGTFPPLAVVAPGVAPAIADLAGRALERRPWRRPRNAGAVARVVREVLASEAAEAQRAAAERRAAAESIAAEAARAAEAAADEEEVTALAAEPAAVAATDPAPVVVAATEVAVPVSAPAPRREEVTAPVPPAVEPPRPVARPIRAASRPIVIAAVRSSAPREVVPPFDSAALRSGRT